MSKRETTFREGDRLWPLIDLIMDTHIDDLSHERIGKLAEQINGWRITHADGSPLSDGERQAALAACREPW